MYVRVCLDGCMLYPDVPNPGGSIWPRLSRRGVGGVAAGAARGHVPATPGRAAHARHARRASAHHAGALAAQVILERVCLKMFLVQIILPA